MLRKFTFALFLLVTLLIGTGCDLDSLTDPIVITEVEDEFNVSMWEVLDSTGRQLEFRIETIKELNCENAEISYSFLREGNYLELRFNEIVEPEDCNPGIGRAEATAVAGRLEDRIYDVEIDLQETIINEGRLSVDPVRYALNMESQDGIRIDQTTLHRVPRNAIWGYISFPDSLAQEAFAAQDQLENSLRELDLNPGYYGYFTLANNTLGIRNAPKDGNLISFIYDRSGQTFGSIKPMITAFRGRGLQLEVTDDWGRSY